MGQAAKTLLGLGATRQKSLGTRRHGQSLSEPVDSHVEDLHPPPAPHHVSPRMAEEDIYLLWSPSSQPRAPDNSLHLMYHLHKATAPWEQGHLLQLYCLNSQLWGKWWQGKPAAAAAVASAVPASLTGHHSGP